jgi:putative ABC transport system permease protein
MVVPKEASDTAEDVLLEGSRSYIYFDKSVYDTISGMEGVQEATAQFYFKSMAADCCSSEVEIVFYDPATDFLVSPWISDSYTGKQTAEMAVVGSSVSVSKEHTITLFGREYVVAAQMAKTGTSMDNSVYFTFDSVNQILTDAEEKGAYILDSQKEADLISTVFLNVAEGYKTQDILKQLHSQVTEEVAVVYPKEMADSLASNLNGIYDVIGIVLGIVIGLSLFILLIISITSANARKQEISILRVLGASKGKMAGLLMKESVAISLLGAVLGCAIAALLVIPFGNYIGLKLAMAYVGPNVWQLLAGGVAVVAAVVLIGVAAAVYPAIHVCSMEPYTALRKEGD